MFYQFQEILHELEEQRELATNRFTELEKLQKDHCEALKEVEKLKMDVSRIPKKNLHQNIRIHKNIIQQLYNVHQ